MAITELPNPPSRSDPANFPERADAFMGALPLFVQETNALAAQLNEASGAAIASAEEAGVSAQNAADSRTQAGEQATAAGSASSAAEQKASEASASAGLAGDWATKTGAAVSGGEFSAKHYAQLAAQGMGLPVRSMANIPTSDVGPIFVPEQGAMAWRNGRYVVLSGDHGQCRFVYVSPTLCRLIPYNGNGLIVNGRQYRIPVAGVDVPNTLGAANGQFYVFMKDDGTNSGSLVPELGSTGSVTRSTNTDGVEIKTGDPSRTLVGFVGKTAANQFIYSLSDKRVMSWFNRRLVQLHELMTTSTTSSTAWVQLTAGVAAAMWAGAAAKMDAAGIAYAGGAGNAGGYLGLYVDGVGAGGGGGYTLRNVSDQASTAVATSHTATVDKVYGFTPYGFTNTSASPVTFRQDLDVMVES